MSQYRSIDECMLRQLFENFVDAGLGGRFEEAIALIEEPYTGIGMGEQGVVLSKREAELVLRGSYRPADSDVITYDITGYTVNFLGDSAAMLFAQVDICNQPKNGEPLYSGLMQTVGARRSGARWVIAFTHASPAALTIESIEAYPLRFMDRTVSLPKAGLRTDTVLYAEINLVKNTVLRLECASQKLSKKAEARTLEDVVSYGIHATLEAPVLQEYHAFWDRLRLLGLFAEGVAKDCFDYPMSTGQGTVWMRAAVEMTHMAHSVDVIAVITYTTLDSYKIELERFTHRASRDALTGVLNREGFDRKVEALLSEYQPKNNTALLMIDLDDFKQINDRLGHQIGDTVLHQVAGVLERVFGEIAAVGRVGGDEFMVLLSGEYSTAFLEEKARELLDSMRLHVGGSKQIALSVSIGIAYGHACTTFEKLYRIADVALYTSKKAGKCRYHMINADTNVEHSNRGGGGSLLSLQTLLAYTEGKEIVPSKTPYEALLENIPVGVIVFEVTDTALKLKHCNEWFCRLLQLSEQEIDAEQDKNPFFFIHPDDVSPIVSLIEQIRGGLDSFSVIYRARHKDGSYRHIALATSVTERYQGKISMYGIATDMGEVVRLKQELELSHSRLSALVNAIPGGVIIISLGDEIRLTHKNNWIPRFLGYEVDEVLALERENLFALAHPEDASIIQEGLAQMRGGKENVAATYRLLGKEGSARHVRINAALTEQRADETTYYCIVTDVAEAAAI